MYRKRTGAMDRVLKNAAFFRTRAKITKNHEKCEKVQKSDFPRKRSHFRKKDFLVCCIRKNFFFGKLFWENEKWTYFFMSIFGKRKIVLGKWIFGVCWLRFTRIVKIMVWQSLKSFDNIGHWLVGWLVGWLVVWLFWYYSLPFSISFADKNHIK